MLLKDAEIKVTKHAVSCIGNKTSYDVIKFKKSWLKINSNFLIDVIDINCKSLINESVIQLIIINLRRCIFNI